MDNIYREQLAIEYDNRVDIQGFLSEIIEWQQESSTSNTVYAVLDTVIDIFIDNLMEE